MTRGRGLTVIAVTGLLATAGMVGTAHADVRAQQKTQVKFEGMLGRMMGLFGGSKAKDGIVQTVSVKGDRKATMTGDTGEIVDLAEEKVYELNLKNKTYQVVTFAEMRKKMEEARAKADEQARKSEAREKKDGKEMEVDFSVKPTGQKRDINGYACRQVVMTIGVHEKGKTLDQSGGILMTVDNWMAPTIAAMAEIRDFDVRYARKLMSEAGAMDMAQAMAMYPGLKDAMARMQKEAVNLEGTPVQTIMTVQTVVPPEQVQARKSDDEKPSGGVLGGMLGRFGKKKTDDAKDKDKEAAPASAAPTGDNKTTFMTSTTDVLSVAPTADAADLQVPAGFKLK
jgi:hypothetical protein